MNQNYTRNKDGSFRHSMKTRRARELNWAVYITSGYVANLEHALTVNAYTMDRRALALLKRVKKVNEQLLQEIKAESNKER